MPNHYLLFGQEIGENGAIWRVLNKKGFSIS
jgi:hypothetical protein